MDAKKERAGRSFIGNNDPEFLVFPS